MKADEGYPLQLLSQIKHYRGGIVQFVLTCANINGKFNKNL